MYSKHSSPEIYLLVRRVFPHLAGAADIGWCWLAWSGVVKVWLGGWNFFLQFESSATAHIETDTSLVLPRILSLYAVLPDCD